MKMIKTIFTLPLFALAIHAYAYSDAQIASMEAQEAAQEAAVAAGVKPHQKVRSYHIAAKVPLNVTGDIGAYVQSHPTIHQGQTPPRIAEAKYFGQVVKNDLVNTMNADPDSIDLKQIYVTPTGYGYRFEIAQVSCDYREIKVNPKTHGITEYYADCDPQ